MIKETLALVGGLLLSMSAAPTAAQPGATHEKPKVEHDARYSSFESLSALRGGVISKPRRIVAKRAQLPKRSHTLPLAARPVALSNPQMDEITAGRANATVSVRSAAIGPTVASVTATEVTIAVTVGGGHSLPKNIAVSIATSSALAR